MIARLLVINDGVFSDVVTIKIDSRKEVVTDNVNGVIFFQISFTVKYKMIHFNCILC